MPETNHDAQGSGTAPQSGVTPQNASGGTGTPESASDATNAAGQASPSESSGRMALTDHLRELRNRLFVCVASLVLCMILGLFFADRIVRALLHIGETYGYTFVYLSPQELLLQYVSVAFVCAACATLPVTLYEIWAFLRPGLERKERFFCVLTMIFGLLFAALGIAFAAKLLVPFMLRFLMGLNADSGAQSSVSVQNYVSFLLTIFVIFAVVFELPVATVLLTQLRLVKVEWLKRARKVMIVVIFFIAAVITPPDIVSQIMVALPLIALYELSILISVGAARLRKPSDDET